MTRSKKELLLHRKKCLVNTYVVSHQTRCLCPRHMFSHHSCYIERGCYQAIRWYCICRSRFERRLYICGRIAVWVPHARCCPLCGEVETHAHAVSACPSLGMASDLVSQLLPQPEVGGIPRSATDLVLNHLPTLLSSAAGLLFWSAVWVNWFIRCSVSMSRPARVPEVVFLCKWLEGLRT